LVDGLFHWCYYMYCLRHGTGYFVHSLWIIGLSSAFGALFMPVLLWVLEGGSRALGVSRYSKTGAEFMSRSGGESNGSSEEMTDEQRG